MNDNWFLVIIVVIMAALMLVVGFSVREETKKDMKIIYLEEQLEKELTVGEQNRVLILQLIDMQTVQNELLLGR